MSQTIQAMKPFTKFKQGACMNKVCMFLDQELHPFKVAQSIHSFGYKYAYWILRHRGATRYQALRAIFFAI